MASWQRNILVTGGAGFIGSHVVIHLTKKYPNYRIVVFDMLDYCGSIHNLDSVKDFPNFKFVQGDIRECDLIRYILQEEYIDSVLHFAAQTHVDLSYWSSLEFTRTNVYGTHVLINAAFDAGVRSFIHVSTDEVYGGNSMVALREEDKMKPTNPYAASKAAAECIVTSYWESFKFPVIITRGNNVYGPHQYPEKAIPKFISLLHRNRKCFIHGQGQAMRNFIYVTDVAEAFDVVMHKGTPGEIYNIGTDTEVTVEEMATALIEKMKGVTGEKQIKSWMEFVQDRPFNDPRYPLNSNKLRKLGWEPKVSWEEGLDKTIEWYKDESHFRYWPNAIDALTDYPTGSNTKRIFKSRNPNLGPGKEK